MGVILAIELNVVNGRNFLWLESNSMLMVHSFQNPGIVP